MRFGTDKSDFAEAFKLAARAGVEKLVVTPSRGECFKFWKCVGFHVAPSLRVDYAANCGLA